MYLKLCGLVTAAVLTGFALLLIGGRYRNPGPVVLALAEGRGVHLGDIFVIAGWAAAMLALLAITRSPARDSTS